MRVRPDAPRPTIERPPVDVSGSSRAERFDQATRSETSGPRVVAPKKTPLSPSEIRDALSSAHTALKGKPIEPKLLDVLTAQVCTENGSGAAMHNYNFGGIKGTSPEGATAKLRTREVLGGKTVEITDGFRAYSTPLEGAKDYIQLLEKRFPRALEAAKTGDVGEYAARLKAGHYFTADAGEYAACLKGVLARGFDADGTTPLARVPSTSSGLEGLGGFDPRPLDLGALPTTIAVVRVMDAVSQSSARIAAPLDDEPQDQATLRRPMASGLGFTNGSGMSPG
ncbi:MAG: hypothetical protein JNK04_00800 [Myxococcales bacterium]|nr:hypothetical protein [Myxococcales bacterium]